MNEFNPKISYWIGLVQADGTVTSYRNKNRRIFYLSFCNKSRILINEFQTGLKFFGAKSNYIWKRDNAFWCKASVNSKLSLLNHFNIRKKADFEPPMEVLVSKENFGAYLAGLIDGDGDIRIKRKKYPQCVIRISSGSKQTILKKVTETFLKCSVYESSREKMKLIDGRIVNGKWFEFEFIVSSKNSDFIRRYVLPYIKAIHKKSRLETFILNKSVRQPGFSGRTF